MNQRTTVALHGTHDALIPMGVTTPRPRNTHQRPSACDQIRYPAVRITDPTGMGETRDQKLDAYRKSRDEIVARLVERWGPPKVAA